MKEPIAIGYLIEDQGEIRFVEDPRGSLRIYEKPKEHCVIGADVSEGIEEDENAAVVLGAELNATLAVFNSGRMDPDEFAIFLKNLGRFYRMPLIGVERNSVGFSVVSDLKKIYPLKHIYFYHRIDEKTKVKTKKFGWITNEHTRHVMLGHLKQEIRESSTDLRDKQLIQQCLRFVSEDGKPQATAGEKDDLVIARAIAGMMKRHRPVKAEKTFVPQAKKMY